MKKVMLVFGTRPEAIKMAPLVKEFQKKSADFETIVCVTGQHREMLDQVLQIFDIKPNYDLNIMKQGQDLYDVTARVLTGMRDVLNKAKPDVVLVHGDTTTSTAAALAAFYQQIPVRSCRSGPAYPQHIQPLAGGDEQTNNRAHCHLSLFSDRFKQEKSVDGRCAGGQDNRNREYGHRCPSYRC